MDEDLVIKVCEEWGELTMDEQAMIHEEMPAFGDALDKLYTHMRGA